MNMHDNRRANTHSSLPLELILQVLSYLDPKDIASVRATCRLFYEASSTKAVWKAALERVCEQHGIFKATYSMEDMTLAELEYAASGPHRFVKRLKAFTPTTTQPLPCRTQVHHFMKRESVAALPDIVGIAFILRLVPGGRYLVTSYSSLDCSCLCLWDLGNNVNVAANPFPLATLEASPQPDDDWSEPDWVFGELHLEIAVSSSGKEILVLGYAMDLDPLSKIWSCSIVVYRINPLDTNPLFHKDGMLTVGRAVGNAPKAYCLGDSIAVMATSKAIFVWNWGASTGCTWLLGEDDFVEDPIVRLCDTVIIACHEGFFYLWDIPELYPVPAAMSEWPIISNPEKRFPRPPLGPEFDMKTMPTYQRRLPQHIYVLAGSVDYDSSQSIYLFSAQPTGSELASGPTMSASWMHSPPTRLCLSDLSFCDGHLVMLTTNQEQQVVAMVLPVPAETPGKDMSLEGATVPLFQDRDLELIRPIYTIGFCPMSGRLVHPVFYPSLHILDFLQPLDNQPAA